MGFVTNAAVQQLTTGEVNWRDAAAAGGGAFLAGMAIAANPTVMATNPAAFVSVVGAVTNAGGSVAGDLANGREVSAGKTLVAAAAGAVGAPLGAAGGDALENAFGAATTSVAGEIMGASATEGAGLALNSALPAAGEAVDSFFDAAGEAAGEAYERMTDPDTFRSSPNFDEDM